MAVEFHDKTLRCIECNQDFIFSAGEAEFYASKNFANLPKRCKFCRMRNRVNGQKLGPIFTEVECALCHQKAVVPFKPKGNRPVFCKPCFEQRNPMTAERQCNTKIK